MTRRAGLVLISVVVVAEVAASALAGVRDAAVPVGDGADGGDDAMAVVIAVGVVVAIAIAVAIAVAVAVAVAVD